MKVFKLLIFFFHLIDVHHLDDIIAMVEDSIINPLRNVSESSQESSKKSLGRYKKIREELNASP